MNLNQLRDLQINNGEGGGLDRRAYDWEGLKVPTEFMWLLKGYVDSKERLNVMLSHYNLPTLIWKGEE